MHHGGFDFVTDILEFLLDSRARALWSSPPRLRVHTFRPSELYGYTHNILDENESRTDQTHEFNVAICQLVAGIRFLTLARKGKTLAGRTSRDQLNLTSQPYQPSALISKNIRYPVRLTVQPIWPYIRKWFSRIPMICKILPQCFKSEPVFLDGEQALPTCLHQTER